MVRDTATASIRAVEAPRPPVSRRGLLGMGVAGGLVPSPSALVVLLSAIALGRTVFGVVLVIAYGAGMAGTLTLAGVLLVRLRDRYAERTRVGRGTALVRRWSRAAPFATASLVIIVGLGLAIRSLALV
jgi:ABC-type nickel/cobalt efflux system permease component RcnA